MCGIAGTLGRHATEPAHRERAEALAAALIHRGPDDYGVHTDGPAALAHRRLAIIDLSEQARQPLLNETGEIAVVVNGEFYGHEAIRRDLERRGHRFRSRCDSEILLHLYEEHGPEAVSHLRGMFAFGLWDGRRRLLMLARDRFGQKPLYWRFGPRGLEFASELQAFRRLPDAPAEIDLTAIDEYLSLQYIPAPRTIFHGIHKLPAGHQLIAAPGEEPRVTRYYRLSYACAHRPAPLVDEVGGLLGEAVRLRLQADVPVGVFLSGGIDSSIVAAIASRFARAPLQTFSVGFGQDPSPELPFARMVADHLGTRHREIVVEPELARDLSWLAGAYGEPFADASALPTYYLSRAAREEVKVAISGDGGDEMFGGYQRYWYATVGSWLHRVPSPLRAILSGVGSRLPGAALATARGFARDLDADGVERYLRLIGFSSAAERASLYRREISAQIGTDSSAERLREIIATSDATEELNQLLDLDVQTYLPDCINPKVDIASMACSLEVRSPMLDHRLAERLATLPSRDKLRWGVGKRLLRQIARDLLPRAVIERPKRGFDPPMRRWLSGSLRPMLAGALESLGRRELFRPVALRQLLDAHDRGEGHTNLLYALLMLELWFQAGVGSSGASAEAARG